MRHTCHAEVLPGPAISYGIDFKVKDFPDDRDLSDAGSDGLHEHFVECSGGAIDARVVQPGGGPMAYISPSLEGAAAVCTADDIHLVHSGHTEIEKDCVAACDGDEDMSIDKQLNLILKTCARGTMFYKWPLLMSLWGPVAMIAPLVPIVMPRAPVFSSKRADFYVVRSPCMMQHAR